MLSFLARDQADMEAILRHRGYIILSLVYAIIFGGYVLCERRPQPEPIEIVDPTAASTLTPTPIQVHVTGAVCRPGVYALPSGSRLLQAVASPTTPHKRASTLLRMSETVSKSTYPRREILPRPDPLPPTQLPMRMPIGW